MVSLNAHVLLSPCKKAWCKDQCRSLVVHRHASSLSGVITIIMGPPEMHLNIRISAPCMVYLVILVTNIYYVENAQMLINHHQPSSTIITRGKNVPKNTPDLFP